jgi:nitrite reductase/ring-hydroxylating ferredoxin subunit
MTEVSFRWSTQDPTSLDNVPYVGRISPLHDRIFTATGFGGWGITNGHAAALMIANEITDQHTGETKVWAQLFDATRIEIGKNLGSVISTNVKVAKALVSDHAKALKASGDPENLQPGQSGLFEGPLRTIAAYKDEQGTLHKVSARCTHMGCLVRFNNAEISWDCPCHGSRFGVDGHVIEGPATEPLHPAGGLTSNVDLTKDQSKQERS